MALAFSTEEGKSLIERLNVEDWLSFAVALRSLGMSGKKRFPFPFAVRKRL